MQPDLKDYLPDLDSVLKQTDRGAADKKHRDAVDEPAKAKPSRAPGTPLPAVPGVRKRASSHLTWKTIALSVVAVAVPCVVFVVLYEKARGLPAAPVSATMTSATATAAGSPVPASSQVEAATTGSTASGAPDASGAPGASAQPGASAPPGTTGKAAPTNAHPTLKSPRPPPTVAPAPDAPSATAPAPTATHVAPLTVLPTPRF